MSGDEPVFRWDAYGISAYDATWTTANEISTISGVNSKKFVRFDKNGIYGINNAPSIDGQSWHPTGVGYDNDPNKEIDANATFALTWEGLKVAHTKGEGDNAFISSTLHIGDGAKSSSGDNTILKVKKRILKDGLTNEYTEHDSLWITEDGDIKWGQSQSPTQVLYNTDNVSAPPENKAHKDFLENKTLKENSTTEYVDNGWHKAKTADDRYVSYTYDGGYTWTSAILI
jgi:hypothetical protein